MIKMTKTFSVWHSAAGIATYFSGARQDSLSLTRLILYEIMPLTIIYGIPL
jgi:hypothetical protein